MPSVSTVRTFSALISGGISGLASSHQMKTSPIRFLSCTMEINLPSKPILRAHFSQNRYAAIATSRFLLLGMPTLHLERGSSVCKSMDWPTKGSVR